MTVVGLIVILLLALPLGWVYAQMVRAELQGRGVFRQGDE